MDFFIWLGLVSDVVLHMGHQDQDGKKVGQMSLFFKSQRLKSDEINAL